MDQKNPANMGGMEKILSEEVMSLFKNAFDFGRENKQDLVSIEHILYFLLEDEAVESYIEKFYSKDPVELQNIILSELYKINDTAKAKNPDTSTSLSIFMVRIFSYVELLKNLKKDTEGRVIENPSVDNFTLFAFILYYIVETREYSLDLGVGKIIEEFFSDDDLSLIANDALMHCNNEEGLDSLDDFEINKFDEKTIDRAFRKVNNDRKTEQGQNFKKIPFLENLNELILNRNYKFKAYGFDEKYNEVYRVLSKMERAAPLIIGNSGVGKTTLIEGMVENTVEGEVPPRMKNKNFFKVSLGKIIAGSKYRGELEERMEVILKFIKSSKNNILVIDGVDGSSKESQALISYINDSIDNDSLKVVLSMDFSDYYKLSRNDGGFERRYEKVFLEEPKKEDVLKIVKSRIGVYERFHNVSFSEEQLSLVIDLAERYIHKQSFPDKVFSLIDSIGSKHSSMQVLGGSEITKDDIFEAVAKKAKIKIEGNEEEINKVINLEEKLKSEIYGQDHAIEEVCSSLYLSSSGLNDQSKPYATMLFSGSTGVGKTELVRQLSKNLNRPLHRFDMSEYAEKHTVSKIIGSPSGYIGHEEGGQMTKMVSEDPYSIILLDEIEKAHPDIYNIFLQVFDYGFLTDSRGDRVSFRNTIIIMTTNAGVEERKSSVIGFSGGQKKEPEKVLLNYFKPEFLNRLSAVVDFNSLDEDVVNTIVLKNINILKDKLSKKGIELKITPSVKKYLSNKGFNREMGARPIERIIRKEIAEPISKEILKRLSKNKKVDFIRIGVKNEELTFEYK